MSDTNWAFTFSATESGVRRWDLRGPAGVVRFQTIDSSVGRYSSVFLHITNPPAGTDPDDIEPCEVCGKGWHDALVNSLARELRAEWESAGCDDEVIRRRLERWYNEELSSPVPASEGSQVSGEVGPGGSGPNHAATGTGEVGVSGEPVPVAAQPRYILDAPAILDLAGRYAAACVEAATTGSPKGREAARDEIRDLWDAIRAALTPVPDVGPEPAWGSGPLVVHNPETPGTGSADPDGGQR